MINIAKPQMGPEEKQAVPEALDSGAIAYVVGCPTYYPVPFHRHAHYVNEPGYHVSMPVAEQAALVVVSLPDHRALRGDNPRTMVEAANSFPRVA